MATLPGSVLWLFLLVYLIHGHVVDNISLDKSTRDLDGAEKTINGTNTRHNEEEKTNENTELEAKKEEETKNKHSSSLINKTAAAKPRSASGKPQESNGIHLSESFNSRNKRRRVVYRPGNAINITDPPVMSNDRRNSYKSISDRRRYYNRTRVPNKRADTVDRDVLELQETTNRPYLPQDKVIQMNEIRDSKQSLTKDSSKVVTETNNQRIILGMSNNETLPKTDNVKQTVIQPRLEFGQKISLRKPSYPRAQDGRSEKVVRRRKEKTKDDSTVENSTNKLNRHFQTQSTKLLKVEKSHWSTTRIPKAETDMDNLVMPLFQNQSSLEKMSKYREANSSGFVPVETNVVTSISIKNDAVTKSDNQTTEVPLLRNDTLIPLPLSADASHAVNTTEKTGYDVANVTTTTTTTSLRAQDDAALTVDEELVRRHVYEQEIYKLTNVTKRPIWMPKKLEPTTVIPNASEAPKPRPSLQFFVRKSSSNVSDLAKANHTRKPLLAIPNVAETTPTSAVTAQTEATKPHVREGQPRSLTPTPEQVNVTEVPSARAKNETTTTTTTTTTTVTVPVTPEVWSTTEEYPLTIEINENNKRVLSEMFQTTTMTDPIKSSSSRPVSEATKATRLPTSTATTSTSTSTTTTTTTSTTTTSTESPPISTTDEIEPDHKPVGSSYNTKFYIVPNVTRTEVIKIVETEEDDDDQVLVTAQTVGIAIYVLAAFGLIPLLLALVFATKFLVQRHRRKDDCDSDIRSDISTNENRTRLGKIKGSTELKKSPSNVTTTTLVATTRLPRVQHWESYDKHGNKNWEFPRSKLKLQTILGQGNFGQVWKAEAEDMTGHEGLTRLVAVKTVKEGATDKEHAELIKELEIMQQIGSHPNIVTLLGCCTEQEPYYLIMEYVMYGKLLTFLRDHRTNENYYNFSNDSEALTSRDLTVFAYCVARGMEYLAAKGIIHRDLAARNVLVDHNKLCKIADFGMSRSVRDSEDGQVYEERQHKGALPIRWMAPESLLYSLFTYRSDVWSFGIVMWEIVTLGSTPYPNMGAREVMRRVRDGYRLERPNHCKPELYRLISHCWAHDPNKRPDFTELRHELSNLLDDPTRDGSYVDLDRFAVDNRFHVSAKTNDLRLLERNEFKTLKRLGDWDTQDWPEETKKSRTKKNRNNGKGTVTLTGHGSFTVNSRILEKEFKMV